MSTIKREKKNKDDCEKKKKGSRLFDDRRLTEHNDKNRTKKRKLLYLSPYIQFTRFFLNISNLIFILNKKKISLFKNITINKSILFAFFTKKNCLTSKKKKDFFS